MGPFRQAVSCFPGNPFGGGGAIRPHQGVEEMLDSGSWDAAENISPPAKKMLAGYFLRIGFQDQVVSLGKRNHACDVELLRNIHRHHLMHIPFQSPSPSSSTPASLQIPEIYKKLVGYKRGGTCFESNLLLAWVLGQLGFQVDLLKAYCATPPPSSVPLSHEHSLTSQAAHSDPSPSAAAPSRGPDHLCLLVHVGGMAWLADVSMAHANGFLEPLVFEPGIEQLQDRGRFRVVEYNPPSKLHGVASHFGRGKRREGKQSVLQSAEQQGAGSTSRSHSASSASSSAPGGGGGGDRGGAGREGGEEGGSESTASLTYSAGNGEAAGTQMGSSEESGSGAGAPSDERLFGVQVWEREEEGGGGGQGTRGRAGRQGWFGAAARGSAWDSQGREEEASFSPTMRIVWDQEVDGNWRQLYVFGTWPQEEESVERTYLSLLQSDAHSLFSSHTVARVRKDEEGGGRLLLRDRLLTAIRDDGSVEWEERVEHEDHRKEILRSHFGVKHAEAALQPSEREPPLPAAAEPITVLVRR